MPFNQKYTAQNIRFENDEQKLRTRLGELRNMLKQANVPVDPTMLEANKLKAGANAYMKYDVPGATEMLQKSEALEAKSRKNPQDPDAIRFKIQSAINSIRGELDQIPSADPRRVSLEKTIDALLQELQMDQPSLQRAYVNANADGSTNAAAKTTETQTVDTVKDLKFYSAEIEKATDLKTLETIATDIAMTLSGQDKARADQLIAAKQKVLAPKAPRINTTKPEALADIKLALSNLALGANASSLRADNAAEAQILWKIQQRGFTPEAVNEGDLNLGRDFLTKAISKVLGIAPTIPAEEAERSKQYIKASIYSPAYNALTKLLNDNKNVSEYSADKIKSVLDTYKWIDNSSKKTSKKTDSNSVKITGWSN